MRAVIDPGPACLDELACRDHRRMAKDGDQVALAAGFDAQHAEAVLGVVERYPVDESGQDLGWRARPGCLRHQGIWKLRSYWIKLARRVMRHLRPGKASRAMQLGATESALPLERWRLAGCGKTQ